MATPAQDAPSLPSGPHHHPVAQTLALLNNWIDYVPPQQKRLGIFIFLAALVHLSTLFFVQIDATRPELRHRPRIQVTLDNSALPGAAPESASDAFWDRLTDPRLYVLPLGTVPQAPDFAAQLDAMNADTHPVAMPSPIEIGSYPFLNQSLPPLAERVEESMQPARQPFTYQEPTPTVVKATTWQWDEALAQRHPANVSALPSPVSDTEINPTRLRIAVDPSGMVTEVMLDGDVLLEKSSQMPDLDRQAILAARKVRFQPTDLPGLQWGFVTVSWYYTPKPREVAPPPAPLAP
jgi:hypothetical protein